MHVEPDPVAHPVAKARGQPGGLGRRPAGGIDLASERAGACRLPARLLRRQHRHACPLVPRRRLAADERAPEVGAVALDDGAEVEEDRLPLPERLRGGGVGRVEPARTPGEDVGREGRAARAVDAQLVLDLLDEVGHRGDGQHARDGRVHCRPGDLAGTTHHLELGRRLHPPQLVHERGALDQLDSGQCVLQLDHSLRPRPRSHGETAGSAEAARGLGEKRAAVGVFVHDDRFGRRLPVQVEVDDHTRQHEEGLAAGRQKRAGDPAVRIGKVAEARRVALEPGQVLEVGGRRQEERIQAVVLEQGAQTLAPLRVLFFLNPHRPRRIARMELIHTCYRITDIDRSVAFYTALGFEERRRMPIREEAINVFMGLPGAGDQLELTYNHGVDSYELGTGYGHIALAVDDMAATLEQVAQQAIYPEREPYQLREGGSFLCFVRDPDGYRVELIERS